MNNLLISSTPYSNKTPKRYPRWKFSNPDLHLLSCFVLSSPNILRLTGSLTLSPKYQSQHHHLNFLNLAKNYNRKPNPSIKFLPSNKSRHQTTQLSFPKSPKKKTPRTIGHHLKPPQSKSRQTVGIPGRCPIRFLTTLYFVCRQY